VVLVSLCSVIGVVVKVVNNPYFEENIDWEVLPRLGEAQPCGFAANRIDYTLTIDTAKKVAMAEQTARGDEVRRYFIECEKQLKTLIPNFGNPAEAARAWALEYEAKETALLQIKTDQPKVEFANHIVAQGESLKIGDFAKLLSRVSGVKIGPNKLFKYLRNEKYLMVGRDMFEKNKPYQKWIEAEYFERKYEIASNGHPFNVTYITSKGQFELKDKILAHFM